MDQQAVVQVNGRRSRAFAIERSVWQGSHLSPLLYIIASEPLLRRLRDERACLALHGISLTGSVSAKISTFADDITVFVFRRLDIVAVKMAVERYEKVAGAKVNFDKSEGLQLGAWRGWRPPARALLLECRTHPYPRGVIRAWPPAGAKLVGSTG